MNAVDSSGWIEYFARGTNASFLAPVVKATDPLVVPTVCMCEVFKRLLAQRGEEGALQAIGIMSFGIIADLTREIAVNATNISSEFKIAMADSIILATARTNNTPCGRKMQILKALVECSTSRRIDETRKTKCQEAQSFYPNNTDRFLTLRLFAPIRKRHSRMRTKFGL